MRVPRTPQKLRALDRKIRLRLNPESRPEDVQVVELLQLPLAVVFVEHPPALQLTPRRYADHRVLLAIYNNEAFRPGIEPNNGDPVSPLVDADQTWAATCLSCF